MGTGRRETLHATCIVVGEAGLLIRGASGAGKSSLALALIDRAAQSGTHAALVADDRVILEARGGRLVARAHPAIAGLVEVRGLGLSRVETAQAAIVRMVVDLAEALPRMPEPDFPTVSVLDLPLPRLALDRALVATGLGPKLVQDCLAVALRSHSSTHVAREPGEP